MKKYFITETDEQVEIGDVINLTCEKCIEDGCVTIEKEVVVSEEIMPTLIEMGVIEVEDEDEEEDLIEFVHDNEDFRIAIAEDIEEILESIRSLNKRVEKLEGGNKPKQEKSSNRK